MRKSALLASAAAMAVGSVVSVSEAQVLSASGPGRAIVSPVTGSPNGTPGTPFSTTATIVGAGNVVNVTVDFSALAHTWVGDVEIRLTHPNGTTSMPLMSRPGRGTGNTFGFSDDFVAANTYSFSDAGANTFSSDPPGTALPSGAIRASSNPNLPTAPDASLVPYVYTAQSFATTFGGLPAAGTWTLSGNDFAAGDDGAFQGWTVNVTVPEPGSMALLGVGTLFPLLRRRRS